jgi:molecular chaperone DnaK
MTQSTHTIGIDLGTTNSVVAVIENEQPVVLVNSEGSTRTPSVVAFPEDPEAPPIVGELAKRQALMNPERTITSVKRLMGRSLAELSPWQKELPYRLAEEDGRLVVKVGDVAYTPSQISAFILEKLKRTAEDYFGEPVDKAVITVPAYFDDLQRQATYEAAELAGLQVLRLLNEPTAAALAYGLGRDREERVAVYDFGGGTFDLTLLDIAGSTFEVLTSVGDTRLGGDDIDSLILERLLEELRKKLGADYTPDAMVTQRLREAAEKAKCELSYARAATISLPFIGFAGTDPVHLEVTLRRSELEAMIRPLIDRTLRCCEQALETCRLRPDDIDRVVLVGGTTRIPAIQQAVEDFFGIPPFKGINPDEIVAIGAATQAAIMQGQLKEVVLLDVTPHSLGVEVERGKVSRVVERNSTIPIKAAKLFTTTEDNQETVVVHVVQGESENVKECRSLGKFLLTGIQPAKAGIPRIQVTFHINADGMVEVTAQDLSTQKTAGITVAVVPGEEEGVAAERDRRAKQRERKRETIVAGRADTSSQSPLRHIKVERQGTSAFTPSATAKAATSVAPAVRDETVAAEKTSGEETIEGASTAAPFLLPQPSTLPCSPATRALLDQLYQGPMWEKCAPDEEIERAQLELERVAAATPDKLAVWAWLAYLALLRNQVDKALNAMIRWARSEAPDFRQAYSLAEAVEKRFGASPRSAATKAWVLAQDESPKEAIEMLVPWMHQPSPAKEICEAFAHAAALKGTGKRDSAMQLLLAKAYIGLGDYAKYDEALKLLNKLAEIPTLKNAAAKLAAVCLAKKRQFAEAWRKVREITPPTEELKELAYQLADECKAARHGDLSKEIYAWLAGFTHPYRDAAEQLASLQRSATPTSQQGAPMGEAALVAAAFADSRFVILEEINRGSMGVIYRARDKVLDEIVALKVLNDYLAADPVALERFKREARAAKKLSHPNIVRIHDMYEIGNKRLISMEYIRGRDIKTILRENGPFDCEKVIFIARAVCKALAHAHQLQIVHRDIKPANIMLTDNGDVKVTDFGIAKFMTPGAEATRSGSQIIGTPLYMAPEQIKGIEVDARTDIYSLGITMYEMLSGRPPFLEGNIEYHHLHSPPPPLRMPTPLELAEIIFKCLAKNPDERFQSAEELDAALAEVECGEM